MHITLSLHEKLTHGAERSEVASSDHIKPAVIREKRKRDWVMTLNMSEKESSVELEEEDKDIYRKA